MKMLGFLPQKVGEKPNIFQKAIAPWERVSEDIREIRTQQSIRWV